MPAELGAHPSTRVSRTGKPSTIRLGSCIGLRNPYGGECNLSGEYTRDFAKNQDNISQISPFIGFLKNKKT